MDKPKVSEDRFQEFRIEICYRLDEIQLGQGYYDWGLYQIVSFHDFRLAITSTIARAMMDWDFDGKVGGLLEGRLDLYIDRRDGYCVMRKLVNGKIASDGIMILR